MKFFTVQEVAEKLGTNPETVRRWVRTGKLHAMQSSRREGNMITEEMLRQFLNDNPKYAATWIRTMGETAIPGLRGVASMSKSRQELMDVITAYTGKKLTNAELQNRAQFYFEEQSQAILRKEELVRRLQSQIKQERAELEETRSYLDSLKFAGIKRKRARKKKEAEELAVLEIKGTDPIS